MGPDIGQQLRLTLGGWMNAVGLHKTVAIVNAIQEERHQRRVLLLGNVRIDRRKHLGVAGAIVGRHLHADEQNPGTGLLRQRSHSGDVLARYLGRKAAQAVVAAQFDNDDRRRVVVQKFRQPAQSPIGGFATDAGVGDLPVVVAFVVELLAQQ